MMKTILKSIFVLLGVMMLAPQGAKARQFEYDFETLAKYAHAQNGGAGKHSIQQGASYTGVSGMVAVYGASTSFTNPSTNLSFAVDFSRFAARMNYAETKGWLLNSESGNNDGFGYMTGWVCYGSENRLVIVDLRPDDEITIYYHSCPGSKDPRYADFKFSQGSASMNNTVLNPGDLLGSTTSYSNQTITFKATAKGDIVLTTTNPQSSILTKIVINRPDVASYDYSPTNYEVYDIYYSTSGTTFQTANAGFTLNTRDAVYLKNLSSGLVLNNRVAVSQSSQGTSQWVIDRGIKAQWSWHNVSICNLEAGDRVRIYFTGEAVFSSVGNSATYNGCPAFLDYYNDGIKNNGQFETTDDGDRNITGGTPVAVAASGWNGTLDQNFKTSEVYVIEADGHLDIGLNGTADGNKGSRIVKIEIYSDHPAMMVDKYNGSSTTGYTSYFDVTGQLQGKEHIMPGGMEIHVGNESTEQYAIVTQTDEGPASFVYDQERYKMARIERGQFNVSTAFPGYGTYYKFIPQVSGKMSLKFKAFSINYRDYSKNGDVAINQYGTPNEEARPNVSCPYYLMVQTSGSTTPSQLKTATYGHGATSDGTFTNIEVEAGKTYWLYGWWSNGSDGNNFSDGSHAAGVAELVEVTFVPNNMVYPLAKWVANGTTSDNDLASVSGTTVTVKKKSANILSCTPIIEGGKLKISGITYAQGADQGGTILLKVGDPNNDDDPVFALTIAYDASKGHKWNFSDNPLKGLKWTNKDTEANVVDFGTEAGPGLLYDEMHEANGHSDWTKTYRVKKGDTKYDLMFLNKYDMVGDNADMMWDTEGLIINTSSNQSCINNEYTDNNGVIDHSNKTNRADPDRYVGILPGGEFRIPCLNQGDRVIIYMGSGTGSGTESIYMNITNALDAVGNTIDPAVEYHAGGSMWNASLTGQAHGDPNYRGAYQFIAANEGDMVFKLCNKGTLAKLYSIEIYSGKHKWSNDATRIVRSYNNESYNANAYQLLNTYTTTNTTVAKAAFTLHYRGKGEGLGAPTVVYKSKNISANSSNLVYAKQGGEHNIFYKSVKGEAGLFRMRIDCMEMGGNYVTDYGLQNITVGYLDKMPYPYTWDFTDLMKYAYTDNANRIKADMSSSAAYNEANYIYEFMNRNDFNSVEVWKAYNGENETCPGYGLNVRNNTYNSSTDNDGSGELAFVGGGQLYAGSEFITEASGLGIKPYGYENKRNGRLRITEEGLYLYEQETAGNYWEVKIPEVPTTAAVYVRAKQIPGRTADTKAVNNSTAFTYTGTASNGDLIYAVKGTGSDLSLFFRNVIVKKIAVSEDAKTVNKLGWNTESRERAIDPSLTAYMTGKDFRTYIVTGVSEENKTATLARIDGGSGDDLKNTKGKLFVPAATNGSINACIIRNADGEAVDLFGTNSGFHLFVPDMHDDATAKNTSLAGNLLKARVTATSDNDNVPRTENGNNNYAFTFKYKKVDENGNAYTEAQEGVQAFYRIVRGGAKSGGNQAYLSIPQVIASSRAAVRAEEAAATPESYTLVFKDWYDLEGEKGDVNGDGLVNEADMELAKDYVTVRKSNGLFKRMGDMNDDGNVDIVDLTLLIKKIMSE